MTTIEILREARGLIEYGWCQGTNAYDTFHEPVAPHEPEAIMFCSLGAIVRVAGGYKHSFYECLTPLCKAIGVDLKKVREKAIGRELNAVLENEIADWNDAPDRTKADVLAAFDRAITIAQEEEAENDHN